MINVVCTGYFPNCSSPKPTTYLNETYGLFIVIYLLIDSRAELGRLGHPVPPRRLLVLLARQVRAGDAVAAGVAAGVVVECAGAEAAAAVVVVVVVAAVDLHGVALLGGGALVVVGVGALVLVHGRVLDVLLDLAP